MVSRILHNSIRINS
jgi:hypothetical protein